MTFSSDYNDLSFLQKLDQKERPRQLREQFERPQTPTREDSILGLLSSKTRRAERGEEPVKPRLLLTRYDPARVEKGEMLKVDDVLEILAIPLLGVIPESQSVLKASNLGMPVVLDEGSNAAKAYLDAVKRLMGEQIEHRVLAPERRGFFQRLLGRTA